MKNSILKNSLVGLVALVSSGAAIQTFAQGNWYLGGAVSQSTVDERSLDEDDTAGKIYAGYKFNSFVGIEGSYYDFGEISNNSSQLEIDGFSLAVVGSIPLTSNFSLFGKVGAHDWDADATGSIASQLISDSDTDAFYGVGVNYDINSNWSVRGEVERYEVEDLDIDVISLGVSFGF